MHERESEVTQSCPTLSNPMDCSLPGSSIHGIFQARVPQWVAIAFSLIGYTPIQNKCLPDGWVFKESCNAGDPGSIPGSGRSPGERISYPLQYSGASLVAQLVKNPPEMWETKVRSLGWEDSLEKGKATHSSILAWRIPWTIYSPWGCKESDMTDKLSLQNKKFKKIMKWKKRLLKGRPDTLISANFKDSAASVPNQHHKLNIAIKWVTQIFWFPSAYESRVYIILRYGVAQSRTGLKRLSSSGSSLVCNSIHLKKVYSLI